jgi:hypothetical protein
MKGLSRKKFHLSRRKFSAAGHSTHPKLLNCVTTPLVGRFLLPLFEPDLNSRGRGQCLRLPTMVLFATPALPGAGPMTISGYAWGHIVATGPRQLPGHPLS